MKGWIVNGNLEFASFWLGVDAPYPSSLRRTEEADVAPE